MFKLLISIPLRICSNICKIPCNTIRFQYLQKLSFCSLNTCHWHCHYLIISTIWKISISMVSLKKFSIPVLFSIFCAIHSRTGSPLICLMLSASLLTHHTTMHSGLSLERVQRVQLHPSIFRNGKLHPSILSTKPK